MRFAVVGAGAVGGFYGALLARSGHEVSFVARGAHLEAIRKNGLQLTGPLGDFVVRTPAESDPARIGPVDTVIVAVKTYDNQTALPLIRPLMGQATTVLTLQNGVDSAEEVAAVAGERATIAGATYIATEIASPGLIRQTGTHRRVVIGEWFNAPVEVSDRVRSIETIMRRADIHAEAVPSSQPAIWEKFTYLAPFAAFTGAARLPIGPLWADADCRAAFIEAVTEVAEVARAHHVAIPANVRECIDEYARALPPSTRSSLLIDLSQGKRIEIESLAGSVVRRGRAVGVPTPRMEALYAVLKPHAGGEQSQATRQHGQQGQATRQQGN